MAPRWEKALHAAVTKQDADKIVEVGRQYQEARLHAALFEAILGALPAGHIDRVRQLLHDVFSSGFDPAADPFFTKYFPRMGTSLGVAEGVQVTLPLDRQTIGLIYAEVLQEAGDLDSAIAVVEDLEPTTIAAVSLAELYGDQGRWDEVISLTDGLSNEDEPSTYLLIQRGIGLREMGMFAASRETLKEALRVRTRPAEMRHRALVERAATYRAEGKNGMARKDLERVFADDSTYPGLREALDALPGA